MATMRRWLLALTGVVGLLSGCCSWCEKHCGRCYSPQSNYAPQMCCPPCPAPSQSWAAPAPITPCPPGCRPG